VSLLEDLGNLPQEKIDPSRMLAGLYVRPHAAIAAGEAAILNERELLMNPGDYSGVFGRERHFRADLDFPSFDSPPVTP
jgi:hypothetical protein